MPYVQCTMFMLGSIPSGHLQFSPFFVIKKQISHIFLFYKLYAFREKLLRDTLGDIALLVYQSLSPELTSTLLKRHSR